MRNETPQQQSSQRFRRVVSASGDNDPAACTAREQTRRSIRAWIRQQQQQQQQQAPHTQHDAWSPGNVGSDANPGVPDPVTNRRRGGFQRLHQLLGNHRTRHSGAQKHDQEVPPPVAEIQCQVIPQIPERLHVSFRNETLPSDPFYSMNLPGTRRPTTNLLDDDSNDDIQENLAMPTVDIVSGVPNRNDVRSHETSVLVMNLPGTRRSTTNLLDDDSDDGIQEHFVQCLKSGARITTHDDTSDVDSYVHHLLGFFPDVHPQRIMDLLRQESLTSTLIVLAEESLVKPYDENACRTELKPATTYAQSSDENRTKILSYVRDMFPQIPASEIESILMQHSIHQGVSILSSNTSEL
jgi:hypothetical protein